MPENPIEEKVIGTTLPRPQWLWLNCRFELRRLQLELPRNSIYEDVFPKIDAFIVEMEAIMEKGGNKEGATLKGEHTNAQNTPRSRSFCPGDGDKASS